MSKPKLVIATDGIKTAAVLDGILIGEGIRKLDFSTEGAEGDMRSTLHVLDLDVRRARLSTDTSQFMDWINAGKE